MNVNDVKHAVSLLPPKKQSMAAEILKGSYRGGSHVTVSPDQFTQFMSKLTPREQADFAAMAKIGGREMPTSPGQVQEL